MPLPCMGQIILDGFNKGENAILCGEAGGRSADYEANVHILDLLKLLIREKYEEYGCGAAVHVVRVACGVEGIGTDHSSNRQGRPTACQDCTVVARNGCPQGGGHHYSRASHGV